MAQDWGRRSHKAAARTKQVRGYDPLPAPKVGQHVQDPEGQAWWDPSLTKEESETRIKGLARAIDAAEAERAPADWLAAERVVLSRLRLRHAVEHRR